jgi:hypothetical protein
MEQEKARRVFLAKEKSLTVIGHLARDTYHLPTAGSADEVVETYGGVLYSVATLSALLSPSDTVFPIFGVSEDEYDPVMERLKLFGNVDGRGVFKMKEPVNQVHFYVQAGGGKTECSKHIAPAIPFQRIKPFLDVHGILINMASGVDILLETLDSIRMQVRDDEIPIHFDFHSLTLGINSDQARFRRPLSDWRRWCFMMHSIQLSEEEAAGLTAERYDEATLINQLMPLMVNSLVITRGDRGATLVNREHKKLTMHEIPGVPNPATVDTVGCGDVFGAAFFLEYLISKDPIKAAESGTRAAAFKTSFRGIEGLSALRLEPATEPPSPQRAT